MKMIIVSFVATSIVLLTGCGVGAFSTRATDPLLIDYQGIPFNQMISTLTLDASRRNTIMRLNDLGTEHKLDDATWRAGEFCTEPSPDAMVNTASQFVADLTSK